MGIGYLIGAIAIILLAAMMLMGDKRVPHFTDVPQLLADESLRNQTLTVSGYLVYKVTITKSILGEAALYYPSESNPCFQTYCYDLHYEPDFSGPKIQLESGFEIKDTHKVMEITGYWNGEYLSVHHAKEI